uniref:Uncharacterized protein n=1 Tax=Aegilops tauschii TaxID=37682 RepID=N1QQX9_AEGTA
MEKQRMAGVSPHGLIHQIAKELDVHGHGIPATVANTTFHGVNALHAACGLGRLPVYQYLIEEVNMVEIDKPDARGNSFARFRS